MSPTDEIPPLQAPTGMPHRAWSPEERADLQRVLTEDCAADRPSFDMDAAVEAGANAICDAWNMHRPDAVRMVRAALTAALPHLHDGSVRRDSSQDARDAERYQWLRNHLAVECEQDDESPRWYSEIYVRMATISVPPSSSYESLDAAIDAAIRAEKEASSRE